MRLLQPLAVSHYRDNVRSSEHNSDDLHSILSHRGWNDNGCMASFRNRGAQTSIFRRGGCVIHCACTCRFKLMQLHLTGVLIYSFVPWWQSGVLPASTYGALQKSGWKLGVLDEYMQEAVNSYTRAHCFPAICSWRCSPSPVSATNPAIF